MRGSIIVTFDELIKDRGVDYFSVAINNILRDEQYTDVTNYYSTFVFIGNIVSFRVFHDISLTPSITITRKDYTTDDEGGDYGIKDTVITPTVVIEPNFITVSFIATTRPNAYNFKYIINATTDN